MENSDFVAECFDDLDIFFPEDDWGNCHVGAGNLGKMNNSESYEVAGLNIDATLQSELAFDKFREICQALYAYRNRGVSAQVEMCFTKEDILDIGEDKTCSILNWNIEQEELEKARVLLLLLAARTY